LWPLTPHFVTTSRRLCRQCSCISSPESLSLKHIRALGTVAVQGASAAEKENQEDDDEDDDDDEPEDFMIIPEGCGVYFEGQRSIRSYRKHIVHILLLSPQSYTPYAMRRQIQSSSVGFEPSNLCHDLFYPAPHSAWTTLDISGLWM